MNMKKIKYVVPIVVMSMIVVLPLVAYSQGGGGPGGTPPITIHNPVQGASTIWELLAAIINKIIMPIAGVVAVIFIIWAGFKYVTAQGNEKKIQEAHQNLLWVLIGVGILLGAVGIADVLSNTIKSIIH